MTFNKFITSASDLVTTHEATRAGFLSIALEKNRVSDPYVKIALCFKTRVTGVKSPDDLLKMPAVRPFLISASGLSDKSLNYLNEDDRTEAIKELIDKFLKPAGSHFIDEVIFRYLLIKGDSVGGTMRNRIGAIGEEKLIRCILSNLSVQPLPKKVVRAVISDAHELIVEELERVIEEIKEIQKANSEDSSSHIKFVQNTVLEELPLLDDNSINGVITSPPYCNRYDYTRTYALELVYLGLGEQDIKNMRQALLSCTVESRSKVEQLEAYYKSIKKEERFKYIKSIIEDNAVLNEVTNALKQREEHGDLNNDGIIRMVQGYFTELAFVYAEIYRVCAPGATIAFVNDNVRYGGEVIPVDFLSSLLAEQFGFIVEKIYCLRQRKGNSSQQMAKFGKVSLRKSITIWKKECPHNKC